MAVRKRKEKLPQSIANMLTYVPSEVVMLHEARPRSLAEEDAVTALRELSIQLFTHPAYRESASDMFVSTRSAKTLAWCLKRNGGFSGIFESSAAKAAAAVTASNPERGQAMATAPVPESIGDDLLVLLQMLSAGTLQLKLSLCREGIFEALCERMRHSTAPKTIRYARLIAVIANLCRGCDQCKVDMLDLDAPTACKNLRLCLEGKSDLGKMNCLGLVHTLTIGSENRRTKMATLVGPVCRQLGAGEKLEVRKMAAMTLRAGERRKPSYRDSARGH